MKCHFVLSGLFEVFLLLICRDVRVQILIWFQTFLLFTKPHFQTFNALKSTSFQAFQIITEALTSLHMGKNPLMPSSHLACDGYMEPVSCPYPPFRAASGRRPCGGRRRLWDLRTDSRAPRPLWFGLARSFTNLKTLLARRHVGGGIAQSPHGHPAKADPRTGSVRFPCGGCGDCTATALTLHDSVQSPHILCTDLPRVAPEAP